VSVSISVVICVFSQERWDDILAAVASVRQQRHRAHEIIVSVDHNPGLHKRLAAELTDVLVVENAGERGLSGGRNTGASVATGDVVAYLDDDAVADAGWLETFAARYQDPRVMGVGGRTLSMWPGSPSSRDLLGQESVTSLLNASPPAECGTRPGWFPEEFDWTVGGTYRGMVAGPVRNVLGGNASFRREVFTIAGGFHTGIGRAHQGVSSSPLAGAARPRRDRPLGCEETEFCIRLRQRRPETVLLYDDGAVIWHRVPEARARLRYFRHRCYAEGLSKALVAQAVGAADGLANERAHALRTLPRGVLRGLAETGHGGLGRAGAITLGLACTTWGYAVGTVSGHAAGTISGRRK
jgi:GT2 family glycosyltransferase